MTNAQHTPLILNELEIEPLKALEDLNSALDNEGNPSPFTALNEQARAAIAKARGQS